jgi:hypothetical protein
MQINVAGEIKVDPKLASAVDQATILVRSQVDPWSSDQVTVDWRLVRDEHGQPALDLTLIDEEASETRRFTLEQVADLYYMRRQVLRLWQDVLETLSSVRMKRLRETVAQLEGN